ncbi:MAG: hypothetical protein ACR2PV_06805 [Gammaproteobacteria bacterium]
MPAHHPFHAAISPAADRIITPPGIWSSVPDYRRNHGRIFLFLEKNDHKLL